MDSECCDLRVVEHVARGVEISRSGDVLLMGGNEGFEFVVPLGGGAELTSSPCSQLSQLSGRVPLPV